MSEKEYIEREAFIIAKRKQYCADCDRRKGVKRGKTVFCYEIGDAPCRSCGIGDVLDDVEDFPAADVAPVRRGRWETVMLDHERMGCRPTAHYCSDCHQITWFRTFYCPNCGAKMDGGADDDDN